MATLSSLESSTRLYVILDIPNFSSADQIRTGYKAMALRYHPDKNIGDPSAVERFREVQMAYEILSDENRRRRYDVALRMATREGGARTTVSENPYMRGMGTSTAAGANFNANIYDELNRYAARAAKARTASAARTGLNKGAASGTHTASSSGAAGAGAAYASSEHTTSQYSRAQQEEFRRRERERNAEMKKQREKERRDQRDRDRDALRREQARQEEILQQQWQQQQKAFAAAQSSRSRTAASTAAAAASATAAPTTPRTGRSMRSKTPPPSANATAAAVSGADDNSSLHNTNTSFAQDKDVMSTPPPDTVPLRRSRPASAAPGQQQRGASSRRTAAAPSGAAAASLRGHAVRAHVDDEATRTVFSPRPVNPQASAANGGVGQERFTHTSSGTSEETTSASTATTSMRRAHTPGRPATPRTARNSVKGNTDGPGTPRTGGGATGRPGGTPVRPNPLSNEDKEVLGRQRSERARQQRGRTTTTTTTAGTSTSTPASPLLSTTVSPKPSIAREESEAEVHRLQKTKQRLERERRAKEAKLAASETTEQRIGYLIEDEAAERQQLIEREELLARQRMLRTQQSEFQSVVLTKTEFVQLIRAERLARAEVEMLMHTTRDVYVLLYRETMDRLHVESLEGAVRRRLYGRRAADTYHVQRAQGQREVVFLEEARQRKVLRYQEDKQSRWMLEVMGPEFFSRCLAQEEEAFTRRRLALKAKKSEYESQSPPRRSQSVLPGATAVTAADMKTVQEERRRSGPQVPSVVVASHRTSLISPPGSPRSGRASGSVSSDLISSQLLQDPLHATPKDKLLADEAYQRYALEHQEVHDFVDLVRHRARQTHALYEADKVLALDASQHAFDVQLRALRAEVARLQQEQKKRSGTPSIVSDLDDSTNASVSTSRLLGQRSPEAVRRRESASAVAPHAPSPVRPTLTPPTSVDPLSPASATRSNANTTTTPSSPQPKSQGPALSPSLSSSTTSPSASAVRGSALAHHYLAATGQRTTAANRASTPPQTPPKQQTAPRGSPSPVPVKIAVASGNNRSAEPPRSSAPRDGLQTRAASRERPAAKHTDSPTRKAS